MVHATKVELQVEKRSLLGKKVRKLRREGLTPANIYGHNVASVAVQVPTERLAYVLKAAGRNEIVYVQLDGEERPAFIRDLQRNPVSDVVLHVDFLQISLLERVKMDVPIHLVGTPPAVDRDGGVLVHSLDHVSVEALPAQVPNAIEVDVSVLEELDQTLHVSDIVAPEGVTLLTDPEVVLAKVAPPVVERVEEVVEEEAAGAVAEEAAEAAEEQAE